MTPRRGPANPATLAALAWMRRRLRMAQLPGERKILREAVANLARDADLSRETLPPKSEPPPTP